LKSDCDYRILGERGERKKGEGSKAENAFCKGLFRNGQHVESGHNNIASLLFFLLASSSSKFKVYAFRTCLIHETTASTVQTKKKAFGFASRYIVSSWYSKEENIFLDP
jgi:hypothetical protein